MLKINNLKAKKNTEERGITLVALTITIIVLLILAGVSINAIFGDSGIINNAIKAKQDAEIASEIEYIQQASIKAIAESRTGNFTVEEMQDAMDKTVGTEKTTAIDNGDTVAIKFEKSDRYYDVDIDGNVQGPIIMDKEPGVLDGTGTETDPFIILSIEDLVFFSQQINEGTSQYLNQYVALGKTLDFNANLSYVDPNTKEYDIFLGGDGTTGIKEQLTKGKGFVPIGNNTVLYFAGNFDGNNNKIKNIKVEVDGLGGLFGYIWGGSEENLRTIKNLTITGSISAGDFAGGIVGEASYNNIKLENLTNYANVTTTGYAAGGIVGRIFGTDGTKSISKCFNYGDITSKGPTGGLLGESYSAIIQINNSINYGKIEGADGGHYPGVGGIIGGGPSKAVTICNSCNYGVILGGIRVGGIYGNSTSNESILANVFNIGQTEKSEWTPGGLAGQDSRFANVTNAYYISEYQYGIGWGSVVAGTKYTEQQLKSSSFVDELNANIENGCPYEVENEDGTTKTLTIDTRGWAKWLYNKNSYPTLDITTIWNGTEWEKIEK